MRTLMTMLLLLLAALPFAARGADEAKVSSDSALPAYLASAIQDPARVDDSADDARRKMAAVMRFTGVKPGDIVVELSPGSGYWTRVFSRVVGPEGHVYTIWPKGLAKYSAESMAEWRKLADGSHYANVSVLPESLDELSVPVAADLVFTSQNYHDFHNLGIDMARFNQEVAGVLKPGGVFVVIDHVAPAGSGISTTDTLHRIDPAAVKDEVEAAGLVFAGSSDALHNPDDPHDIPVFDDAIRGHSDQFIFRFRKPDQAPTPKP